MQILLIEDDNDKSAKIRSYLQEEYINLTEIIEKKSFHSGLKELIERGLTYDIVLMDMSMPNFDISAEEPAGGSHENFAGRDLLSQMKLRMINIPVLIVTQYDTFGVSFNKLSLDELKKQLDQTYLPIYKGTIYYNSAQDSWKKELKTHIDSMIGRLDD